MRRANTMRKKSRRNCDRFGECRGVVFIIKTLVQQLVVGTGLSFRVTLREESEVELLGETPDALSTDASLPKILTLCQ
jgi:hypothetical protein